jgi:transcriptional regulator with XRE-family HTH domain
VNVNYFPHPQDNASFATVNRRPQEIATMTSASKDAVLGRLEGVLLERKRAARARSDKPQSQKDLAAAARIHESRLSRVLSGELALRADEIVRLSEVLGVRAGWLQFGEEPKERGDTGEAGKGVPLTRIPPGPPTRPPSGGRTEAREKSGGRWRSQG